MFNRLLITTLLLVNLFLQAQEKQVAITRQLYDIHNYTTKDGLSQVSINDIVQDDEGFLWIATQNGLNRFDGTSFYTFEQTDFASNNCGTYINTLVANGDKIWFGTRATGLCYYDKKKHHFQNMSTLHNFDIENMAMGPFHHLYVTIENKGIAVIKKDDGGDAYNVFITNYFEDKDITATSLFISKSGMLWVGTKEGRLFYGSIKSNPKEIIFNEFDLSPVAEKIFVINANSDEELWIGTQSKLCHIDLVTKKQYTVPLNNKSAYSFVIYELKWNKNILWVGTGSGLIEYDTKKQKVVNKYIHSEQHPASISNNVIYSILVDSNNQIWVGTGKYLNLFYQDAIFNKIQNNSKQENSLNSNVVFSILKNGNDLWVGTSGGGINLLRDNKRYVFTKQSGNLPSNICFSLLKDKDMIWAGTREGLVLIDNNSSDFKSMKVKTVLNNSNDETSLSSNFVRYLYKDTDDNIWLCTSGGGLERFTGNLSQHNISFEHHKHNTFKKNTIASDKVNYILQTDKNHYWIATDKGLNVMTYHVHNPENTDFKRLTLHDTVLLDKEVIYTLLKDRDSGIWIGTTNGLYYFFNQQLQRYHIKNGLPDNVIYAILEDFQGNIWVSTNKGLSRFDKETKSFTNYHQSDGLSSEEYDLHAKFIDNNGIIYFGGIDGITCFDPAKLISKKNDSKLYIDNVQITNPESNSIETLYTENNQPIAVKQKQFPVTINFSNINLKYYKNTTFAYRLLPDNTRWNIIKEKRFIQLLNLPPDDYILEIREAPHDRISKNDNLIRIPLTVVPVWWQSKWAYFVYLLIILFLLYLYFRFSFKRKMEHQENVKLKELDNLKSRLYANITHEFRTPLTVIKGITNEIKDELSASGQKHYKDKMKIIERNSDKLLHLVKQMLDMSKIEDGKMKLNLIQDNIVSYLQYILESFQSMADSKNTKLIFYHEIDKIIMDYDQDKIFIIASNLLSNAIKFTPPGGKVIFHVKQETGEQKDMLIIKVQDSGIGIEAAHLKYIFDRFYQIDNSSTRKGEGTGIGLALTKELVELLGGKITVKSVPGVLTEFCISIPVTHQAPTKKTEQTDIVLPEYENTTVDIAFEDNTNKDLPLALIVEDNPDVAQYIISCIKKKYRVKWSPDGGAGVEAAIQFIPDIIISDVMMPVKDGFEVCEILKQDERTSHIPIILLTAKATDNDRIEGLSHGADAYLTKPFNKEELFVRLEQLIKLRRQLQQKFSKVEINLIEKTKLTVEEKFLKKVITIIENNLDNSELNGMQLASELNLSESQLYRKLKAVSDKSTALFIRSIRLSAAKEMLTTTDNNISQIAYLCGFNNPAWFSNAFKEVYGVSPTDYKNQTT
jgi:signal transduction histidine kinase/ligand-binding sensor domain-containing protein/DNA-binding response OmpR family regulator